MLKKNPLLSNYWLSVCVADLLRFKISEKGNSFKIMNKLSYNMLPKRDLLNRVSILFIKS